MIVGSTNRSIAALPPAWLLRNVRPALRWWSRMAAHIPSDCRLSDLEAELKQFSVNVWGRQSGFAGSSRQ